jgi:phenol hydroxylase P3 protein
VQRWVDKWFWRSFRLMPMVAMLQDYMVPKRVGSWRESWDTYVEAPVEALFAELAPYGLKKPNGWQAACASKDHLSHQAWNAFYGYGHALAFHTWVPGNDELEWLDRKYPNSFDRWYRPRLAHYAQREAAGQRFHNHSLPMQCQVCQQPMMFTEPGDGRWIAYRETQHHDESFHFCSDQCETIFTNEPDKYVQAKLPSHVILQARSNLTDDAMQTSIAELGVVIGRDNGEFHGSEDDTNFTEWGGGQDMKEAQL